MSAIASFIKIPKSSIDDLRKAAVPTKPTLFRPSRDVYHDFLAQHGRPLRDYEWSGYVFGTLLPYLADERHIDLMKSDYDELSEFLTNTRGSTHIILTNTHKVQHLDKLHPDQFTEEDLRHFYATFNEVDELEAGKRMLDGVRLIHQNLADADEESIIILSIG